jgi:hypothetical protein
MADGGITCHTVFQEPSVWIKCSEGYVQDSDEAVEIGCRRQGLPCPEGLSCMCQPCIPVLAINMFPWQVVLGLCVALFASALGLTLGWRGALDLADDWGPPSRPARKRGGWKA